MNTPDWRDIPPCGSDPAGGIVYLGQKDGPPIPMDLEQAQEFMQDLLGHIIRAAASNQEDR